MASVAHPKLHTVKCAIEGVKEIYLLSCPGCQEVIFEFTTQKAMQAVATFFKEPLVDSHVKFKFVPGAEANFKELKICCAFLITALPNNQNLYMGDILDRFLSIVGDKVSPREPPVEKVVRCLLPRKND